MDISKLKTSDWVIGGSGLVLLITSFLDWFTVEVGGGGLFPGARGRLLTVIEPTPGPAQVQAFTFKLDPAIIRRELENYSRQQNEIAGYEFVHSPHITKGHLFETSGHLAWYAEGMYPAMQLDEERDSEGVVRRQGQDYYLKPMNCPMHNLVFDSRGRSYRELPLRLFEFGSVYRYEKSGVVHGLTRVRGFTPDDAHIYCTPEQLQDELASLLEFVLGLLRDYGLTEFTAEVVAVRRRRRRAAAARPGRRAPRRRAPGPTPTAPRSSRATPRLASVRGAGSPASTSTLRC